MLELFSFFRIFKELQEQPNYVLIFLMFLCLLYMAKKIIADALAKSIKELKTELQLSWEIRQTQTENRISNIENEIKIIKNQKNL
jgi:hypothetical protein